MLRRTNDRERERKMEAFDKDLFVEMLCKDRRATVVSAECDPFKLKKWSQAPNGSQFTGRMRLLKKLRASCLNTEDVLREQIMIRAIGRV